MTKLAVRTQRPENFQPKIPCLAKFIYENDVAFIKTKIWNVGKKSPTPRISEPSCNRKILFGIPSSRAFKNKIMLIVIAVILLQMIRGRASKPPFAAIRLKNERHPLRAKRRVQNIFFNLNRCKSQKRHQVKTIFGRKKSLVVPHASGKTARNIELQIMLWLLIFARKKIRGAH